MKGTSSWINKIPTLQPLGKMLISKKKITESQLEEALAIANSKKIILGQVLQDLHYVTEEDILETFASALDLGIFHRLDQKVLDECDLDYTFFSKFSLESLEKVCAIPYKIEVYPSPQQSIQMWHVHVILNDPWKYNDIKWLVDDYIRRITSERLTQVFREKQGFLDDDIQVEIIGYLAKKNEIEAVLGELHGRSSIVFHGAEEDEEQTAARTFREIISEAIRLGATDVHISPLHQKGGLWTRIRIDGTLCDLDKFRDGRMKEYEYNTLLNKVMNMADMDITKKREPQDGAMTYQYDRTAYDLRIAVIPTTLMSRTLDGCKIQIRILYKSQAFELSKLGFMGKDMETIRTMYTQPNGVFLVAGPTSSGKTTTIYSVLKQLDLDTQCCYTVEDPVEYHLEGAYQIKVAEKEGRSFAAIMKSLMRLDPDIVFMGEIRDPESALIATQIANTGHTVFSTIHTNAAYTAPLRLLSMGIPNYMLSGNLVGVTAQRLVRAICPNCRAEYAPDQKTIATLGLDRNKTYFKGTGTTADGRTCPVCKGSGYKGRMGIYELMPLCMYDGWEPYLNKPTQLHAFFTSKGHPDLMGDAKRKMEAGLISPEALLGVLARTESIISNDEASIRTLK